MMANRKPKPRSKGDRGEERVYFQKGKCRYGLIPQPPFWDAPHLDFSQSVDGYFENGERHV
jgi:hypothetical protein